MLRTLRHFFALVAPLLLLALHLAVVLCFWNRWDEVTAVTLIPIWVWAAFGVAVSAIVWPLCKSRFAAFTFALWTVTGVSLADETSGLVRQVKGWFVRGGAELGPADASAPDRFRVATIDLAVSPEVLARAVSELSPLRLDAIFVQHLPEGTDLAALADGLFGKEGSFVRAGDCAIAARGKLSLESDEAPEGSLVASLERADGEIVDLMNVALPLAMPGGDWWRPEGWVRIAERRRENRRAMRALVESMPERIGLERQIAAGSFGVPPGDDIFRLLKNARLSDSFRRAGHGWGDTYPPAAPVLRAGQIWATAHFQPLRAETRDFGAPGHRAVLTEFLRVTIPEDPLTAPEPKK